MSGPLDHIVGLDRIVAARAAIEGRVHRTPLLTSTTAARVIAAATGVRLADDRLFMKSEHLQKTGSFKPRGMVAKVLGLTPEEAAAGIITFSAGNAAQGYAYAGAALGVHVTVVMPARAVQSKVEACVGYGAEVILHGDNIAETFAEMERVRDERGLTFCHPFDDPEVIAGYGSIGLELLEDVPDLDVVVVGVGSGGLISGVAAALRETRPSVRVYGVEPEGSTAMSSALAAGHVVPVTPMSVADGLGAPFAGEWTLAMVRRYVDDVVLIDDSTILAGVRFAAERVKQILEPAGAAGLAALLFGRVPLRSADRVGVVLCGGNVEISRLGELIAGAAPIPGLRVDPRTAPESAVTVH